MIAFSQLGQHGRLGNQLFQYAFLRATARRLGVSFHCPSWIGDSVFVLNDEEERAPSPLGLARAYAQPRSECGFSADAGAIEDATDVVGYFQSPRHFGDPTAVRTWFTFREPVARAVREKYAAFSLEATSAFHLRLGDYRHPLGRLMHYPVSLRYFERNARRAARGILVFSDEPDRARVFFRKFDGPPLHFVEGNQDYEDLYLMTQCRGVVGSASTFSWWGAWLNPLSRPEEIVFPDEWFRRGYPCRATDLFPSDWRRGRAHARPTYDYRLGNLAYRPLAWTWNRVPSFLRPSLGFPS